MVLSSNTGASPREETTPDQSRQLSEASQQLQELGNPGKILASNHAIEDKDWDDEDLDFEEDEESADRLGDPLAPWNRAMFHVTDKFYFWVLRPVARGYGAVVPRPVRMGIKNVFHNSTAPLRILSCLLQGKARAAGGEFAGLLANSTVGLLGIFDITKDYPALRPPEEDLGQVFGAWGIGNGIYIYWPFLGPSTLRDSLGTAGERFLNPTSYIQPYWIPLGIAGVDTVNAASFRIGDYESLKDAAIEPYEAFRDAYIQNRMKSLAE